MSPQLKSQLIGISLAILTAIGCIAYEKLVKQYSFGVVVLFTMCFYIPLLALLFFFQAKTITGDLSLILHDKKMLFWSVIYILTWVTTPIWYTITRHQGVLTGSIYEVKYIVILVIFYILFGDGQFTYNTLIGVALALGSIYFVSK